MFEHCLGERKFNYVTDQDNGYVMEFGPYDLLQTPNEWDSTHVFVEYELPLEEGGALPMV